MTGLAPGAYRFGFANAAGDGIEGDVGTITIGGATTVPVPAPPINGAQTTPLPENPPVGTVGPRIVGPWLTLEIRDRRYARLKPAVRARSYKIDRYVKPGYWIRIDP